MAALTLTAMVNLVLEKLGVLESGETAEAEDGAKAQAAILRVNEKLRTREIAHWSDAAFPEDISDDLAVYAACHCADPFLGKAGGAAYRAANKTEAFAELKRLTSSKERVDKPTQAEFF